jgi:hypothetical protein
MVCFYFIVYQNKKRNNFFNFYSAVFDLNVTITILFKHIIRKLRY